MKLDKIRNLATSKTARQVLRLKKHSPKTLFVLGTAGVVGAAVLACRATLKMDEVLDNYEKERNLLVNDAVDEVLDGDGTIDVQKKKHTKLQVKTALDIAKLYTPAVGLGLLSIGALTGSHVILDKRNSAAMAAYMGIDRAFKEYRGRVSDEFGKDIDRKFVTGAETVLIEEKTADGKTKTRPTDVIKKDGKFGGSPYAVVFDEQSRFFSPEPGMNASTLQMKQSYANDKLRANGHLFLNEALDMLGLPRTEAGCFVGWVYRKDNEKKNGDNYVDFGIFTGEPELVEAFIDGNHKYATLDFNVDGPIYKLI